MDKKKTVWVILASGVFLCVVFVAALILWAPDSSGTSQTASIVTIPSPSQTLTPAKDTTSDINDIPVLPGTEGVNGPDLAAADTMTAAQDPKAEPEVSSVENNAAVPEGENAPAVTTIDLNTVADNTTSVTPKSQPAYEAIEKKAQAQKASTIYTAAAGDPKKPANKANTQTKKSDTPAKTTAAVKTEQPKAAEIAKYWVQAASYTTKKGADNARTALDDNRIPAEVFTYRDNKDNLYYRVRVGPYTTKSEAEYWKNRICQIDSFKNTKSYITVN